MDRDTTTLTGARTSGVRSEALMTVSEENTCPAQYGITGLSLGRYEG